MRIEDINRPIGADRKDMAYCEVNFKTKAALKAALKEGRKIGVYSPGPFPAPENGKVGLEGPHFPAPHSWYGEATIKDGVIVSVK